MALNDDTLGWAVRYTEGCHGVTGAAARIGRVPRSMPRGGGEVKRRESAPQRGNRSLLFKGPTPCYPD